MSDNTFSFSFSRGRMFEAGNRKVCFLTGGSGVVGQALLSRDSGISYCCLVHRSRIDSPSASTVRGDVRAPRLGLKRQAFERLADRIGTVVHAAAETDFLRPPERLRAVNVQGTAHVLELAARAAAPFYHVSTGFVPRAPGTGSSNAYELSKQEAEGLVRQSGLPYAIVRPSLVAGDSRTGKISKFQGLHLLMSLYLRGFVSMLPADPGAVVDFVPCDWVAECLERIVRTGARGEFWLTLGEQAPRLDELSRLCTGVALQLLEREIPAPRLVPPDAYERLFKPVFLPDLPARARRLMEQLSGLTKYLNVRSPLPATDWTEQGLPPPPEPLEVLRRNLEFVVRTLRAGERVASGGSPGPRSADERR